MRLPGPLRLRVAGVALALGAALCFAGRLPAQSITAGDVAGVVADQSGATIPGATVTITNNATAAAVTVSTDAHGGYRFSLLTPGSYTITAGATGFTQQQAPVVVNVGEVSTASLSLKLGTAEKAVTVSGAQPPVQTQNGDVSTSFSAQQVALVPNGGGDLTSIVQSTPGAVMDTQGGYGNFSTFGLPATANLFTINGMEYNDPFLNTNNSGATNLTMGQNDIQEVTVTNNGYSGQFGQLGGANVNYVTKSGSNTWHGNAIYTWNGDALNANNFFNNASATPRPTDNANQWQASLGGYVNKNKTFFFVDTEGLYVTIPTSEQTLIPSSEFESATLANLNSSGQSGQVPFYDSMFALYNAASGASRATAVPGGGCAAGFTLPDASAPCALEFYSNATNTTHEWNLSERVDEIFSANDHVFLQLSIDRGLQATYTDPISPAFNISSNQPQAMGQLNWTHAFASAAINELVLSAMHYGDVFGTDPAARSAVFPLDMGFVGGVFTPLGGDDYGYPQGRNVTQYGLVDNYSRTIGGNTFKAGADYNLDYINDYDLSYYSTPVVYASMASFYNGMAEEAEQSFPTTLNVPVRQYESGMYVEDDARLRPNLTVTMTVRLEHDSNPVCAHNCFSSLVSPFTALNQNPDVPYDDLIDAGAREAYPSFEEFLWEPRFGFAWTPFPDRKTVLRGGFGIFHDSLPGEVADDLAENSPNDNTFVVAGALSPAVSGNVMANASADNTAFLEAFRSGGNLESISNSVSGFSPPGMYSTNGEIYSPEYEEWNLELERQLGRVSSISANYVGNRGIQEPIQNGGYNAYAPGFTGLPASAPDAAFGTVTQLTNAGISNYNGLVLSFSRRFSQALQVQLNYTWSHALDDVSNGGFEPFDDSTNLSLLSPQNPYDVMSAYGNSDYDVADYFSANYVWQPPLQDLPFGPHALWRGWNVSGALFTRTGLPFTVIDSEATEDLEYMNYGGTVFASVLAPGGQTGACSPTRACLNPADFSPANPSPTSFGEQMRNQYFGPGFFDTDMSITKNTSIPGWESAQLGIGVEMFNLFNHPNFDQPVNDVASPQFGTVINTVSVPTSILGSGLGGDASPRIIQLTARINF